MNVLKALSGHQWLCDPAQLESCLASFRAGATAAAGSTVNAYAEHDNFTLLRVDGLMVPQASPLADMYQFAIAERLQENILKADARGLPAVFRFTSPGGMVDQVSETADLIYCMSVPTIGYAASRAQSAAFWLYSQCDYRYAQEAALLGSVGVVGARYDANTDHIIVSQHAQNKLGSREQSRSHANQIESFFHNAISRGTGLSVEEVIEATDGGASFFATEAQQRRLITGVSNYQELVTKMNFARLQKSSPSTPPPQVRAASSTNTIANAKAAGKTSIHERYDAILGSPYSAHQKDFAIQLAASDLSTAQCIEKLKAKQPDAIGKVSAQAAADRYTAKRFAGANAQASARAAEQKLKPATIQQVQPAATATQASAQAAAQRYAQRKGLA